MRTKGVMQQRTLLRRALRLILEITFEKVLRRVLRRRLGVGFNGRKGSEKRFLQVAFGTFLLNLWFAKPMACMRADFHQKSLGVHNSCPQNLVPPPPPPKKRAQNEEKLHKSVENPQIDTFYGGGGGNAI